MAYTRLQAVERVDRRAWWRLLFIECAIAWAGFVILTSLWGRQWLLVGTNALALVILNSWYKGYASVRFECAQQRAHLQRVLARDEFMHMHWKAADERWKSLGVWT